MKIKNRISDFFHREKVRQITGLLSANLLGIPLGIVTNIIVTRYMGPQIYGDYKFIHGVFSFAIIFLTFGFYYASNRAVLMTKEKERVRELYGASFIITVLLFILLSIAVTLYALFDPNIAEKGLTKVLILSMPLGFVYLWGKNIEEMLPANNQIGLLSKLRLYPRILNLIFAGVIYFFFRNNDNINRLLVIIALYGTTQLLLYIYCSIKIKVSFHNIKNGIGSIFSYEKSYGFNVYVGALFASGFSALTEILISYFGSDNSGVGFYSLANTLSNPLIFIPATIATTHYKDFATQKRIPSKLLKVTFLISAAAIIGLWVIVPPFVHIFYGEAFSPVIKINFFVSIGVLLYGFADFLNRFLCAKGAGKELRNASFVVGFGVMVANLIFIPLFGPYGAAYAKIVAGLIFIGTEVYYYKKITARSN